MTELLTQQQIVSPVIVWQGIKMVKELLPDIKEEMKL